MKPLTFQPVLFGMDLRDLTQDWSQALQGMAQWPGVRWLTPGERVQLHWPDGRHDFVHEGPDGSARILTGKTDNKADCWGRVIHDDQILWYTLLVTGLSTDDIQAAVTLETARLSPFAPEDLVYTHILRAGPRPGEREALIAITARQLLAPYLVPPVNPAANPQTKPAPQPELWLQVPPAISGPDTSRSRSAASQAASGKTHSQPAPELHLLPGYGESRRHQRERRWRLLNLLLLTLVLASLALAAMTPSLQLRERVQHAHDDYTQLQARAVPAQQAREHLVQWQDKVGQVQKMIGNRLVPEHTLLLLTRYLPDDTYLIVLDIRGQRIEMVGVTPNANALMLHLERQPGIKRVVALNPARREGGREVFSLEFQLDTAGMASAPEPATPKTAQAAATSGSAAASATVIAKP